MRFFMLREAARRSRILQHHQAGQYAVFSAEKRYWPKKENWRRTKKLVKELRRIGFGFKRVVGRGQEDEGGKKVVNLERSVFVPHMRRTTAHKLAKHYRQDYMVHGNKGVAHLIHVPSGRTELTWKTLKMTPAKFDSLVRGWSKKLRQKGHHAYHQE